MRQSRSIPRKRDAQESSVAARGSARNDVGGSAAHALGNRATGMLLNAIGGPALQRKCAAGGETEAPLASPAVNDALASPGRPLDEKTRGTMESRLGQDFGGVRVHEDAAAGESARGLNAQAYTVGRDIVFAPGQYAPGTEAGTRLLAHELAHVTQQRAMPASGGALPVGPAGSPAERQADAAAQTALDPGAAPPAPVVPTGLQVARNGNPQAGASSPVSRVEVSLTSNTIDFHTASGLFRYDLEHSGLPEGEFTATVRVRGNNVNFTLDVEGGLGKGKFRYHIRAGQPNPSTFFRGQTSVPFRISSDEAPEPSAPAATAAPAPQQDPNTTVLTPEEAQRRCEANDLPGVKVFPFRATRFGAAPVMAHREGGSIVVKQPVYVLGDRDFRAQTRTLPVDTFIGGTRLDPNEVVRVHVYEPRWYHLNITGSTSGDIEREFCVTGEQMLQIADASTKATYINIGLTVVDAATLMLPVGKLVGMAAQPLVRAGRIGLTAGMLGLADVAPTALAGMGSRAAVTMVEEQAVTQVVGRTLTQTVSVTAVRAGEELVAPRLGAAAVPRLGGGLALDLSLRGTAAGLTDVAGGLGARAVAPSAEDAAFEAAWRATFLEEAPSVASVPFQTTQRLIRGNLGERLAAESLATDGHVILSYKPSILGTNQGGIDIVTMRNGVLHLIDNKALTRSGNVSSVSALTTNFTQNLAAVRQELVGMLAEPARTPAERTLIQDAINALNSGNYVRAVTNANVAPDTAILSGVTQNLASQGIQFIDVF